jgi:cytochrome c peroxidase
MGRLAKISAVCSTIAAALLISAWLLSAQNGAQEAKAAPAVTPPIYNPTPPIYNPYPPGILPPDLNSELLRVQREVAFIENEAIGQWHAIPPPILTGNPPILQNTGVASVEILGKLNEFRLKHLSLQKYGLRVLPHAVRRL